VYLHKFRNGWKVVHTQAIENIYWKAKGKYNYTILKEVFQDSPLFKTQKGAMNYALKLYNKIMKSDCPIIEYGISIV